MRGHRVGLPDGSASSKSGDDASRVVGIGDEVQDGDQDEADWLARDPACRVRRVSKILPGFRRSASMYSVPPRGRGQQRTGVGEHDRVAVDADDPGLRGHRLRDLVTLSRWAGRCGCRGTGGCPVVGQRPDGAAEEARMPRGPPSGTARRSPLVAVTRSAASVLAAQVIVVHSSRSPVFNMSMTGCTSPPFATPMALHLGASPHQIIRPPVTQRSRGRRSGRRSRTKPSPGPPARHHHQPQRAPRQLCTDRACGQAIAAPVPRAGRRYARPQQR